MYIDQAPALTAVQEERGATAQRLIASWYPRINALLFDSRHALPFPEPHIDVKETLPYADVPAYAERDTIHLWAKYIETQDEDDFEGMVIHELTHINQAAKNVGNNGWVVEGVADYVRHKYFAKDIKPLLHLSDDGRLVNYRPRDIYFYSLQQQKADLRQRGYEFRYTVASTFLYWLERRKDARIVREISRALEQGRFSTALFARTCGKPLDSLWREFIAESRRASHTR